MKNKKIIIGLSGELASGKGSVSSYLVKKYQAIPFRFSNPLRDILNRLGKDLIRKNFNQLSTSLRKIYGDDYLVDTLLSDLEKTGGNFFVLDGIRKIKEVKRLKKIKNFHLIYVDAGDKIRWQRLQKRSEKNDDQQKTFSQFQKDAKLETELDIKKIKKIANYQLDNSGNLENLHKNIEKIIKKILSNTKI